MKKLSIVSFITLLFLSAVSANDEAEVQAELLLESMDMDYLLQQSILQMNNVQIQQNPSMAPYQDVMLTFLNKYMSYDALKADMIQIYSRAFTSSELKDINAFYATPTGKKTIQRMPEIMAQGAQLGAAKVQENISELQEMIKAESERLLESQGQE